MFKKSLLALAAAATILAVGQTTTASASPLNGGKYCQVFPWKCHNNGQFGGNFNVNINLGGGGGGYYDDEDEDDCEYVRVRKVYYSHGYRVVKYVRKLVCD